MQGNSGRINYWSTVIDFQMKIEIDSGTVYDYSFISTEQANCKEPDWRHD